MENLIFDNSGVLTNYYQKNIEYYFEFKNNFVKSTKEIINKNLYTRVLKLSKRQYYFENKKNCHIVGILNDSIINIKEDLSGYDFFFNQPILVNNIIKFIKNIKSTKNSENIESLNFTISDGFNGNDNNKINLNTSNVKIYFGKRNINKIYSNYSLDKVNFLKPEINLGLYHYYDISFNKIVNYDISNNYLKTSNNSNNVIFKDNIWLNDDTKYFLNKSYHILLEKTINQQHVSYLCQFEFCVKN
jgi:hypothetical protein